MQKKDKSTFCLSSSWSLGPLYWIGRFIHAKAWPVYKGQCLLQKLLLLSTAPQKYVAIFPVNLQEDTVPPIPSLPSSQDFQETQMGWFMRIWFESCLMLWADLEDKARLQLLSPRKTPFMIPETISTWGNFVCSKEQCDSLLPTVSAQAPFWFYFWLLLL